MAKVSISSLVVVGAKEIIRSGKLYDESVDLPAVIKSAMDKAAAQAERSLCFMKAEAFASVDAMERRGFELDTADLPDMTVKNLRDHFGQFIKLHAEYAEVETGATSLPSVNQTLMQAQQQRSRALPTPPSGGRYDFRLFRALLVNIEQEHLSFPLLDADCSGKSMLNALALALQYVLPFDDAESSLLRAAGRVHLVVPARFKTETLNNEKPSMEHHGPKKTEARRAPRSTVPRGAPRLLLLSGQPLPHRSASRLSSCATTPSDSAALWAVRCGQRRRPGSPS